MPYRVPAHEIARRDPPPEGPLLRLDVTGRPGAAGQPGHRGRGGASAGQDGSRGGDAGRASPGEAGGNIEIEIASDPRDGIARVRGAVAAGWQARTPFEHEVSFDRAGEIELVARGGRGGDGGHGGPGGDGAEGRRGASATRSSSGGDGGRGGDGGDGGDGTSGEVGGRGGTALVRVHERDTHLLMLVAHDVGGGEGGRAGENGARGRGGSGGPGGSSYSWTETESYTDSEGKTQTRTHFRSNPGGSTGPRGRDGRSGSARLASGPDGAKGSIAIEVTDDGGRVKARATSRYDVELVSFAHRNENDDGVYEPEERVLVTNVVVLNKGGMELPAHHDVIVRLRDDGWIAPKEGAKLTLPRALPPGKTHVFSSEELELTLRLFRPQQTGGPLAAPETIRLFAELPDARRAFGAFTSGATEEMGRIVVSFPIELSPIVSLYSLAPGQAARVRWSITNVSARAFGVDSSVGRAVGIRLRLEGGELFDEHVLFVDAAGARHSLVSGFEVAVPRLEAKQTATFEGVIAIAPDAPAYASARLLASAELGHIAAPTTVRPIQLQELAVRVGQPFEAGDADVLVVTNNKTTREELLAWRRLVSSLGLTSSLWDASLEGGVSVLSEIAAGARRYGLVVLLNDTMDTVAGERRASVLVDKATVHGLARAGTQVLFVGRAPDMETLAVPVTGAPDELIEAHRWYHWPWSEPKEAELEERASEITGALARAFPGRRFVAVHRFDPAVTQKVATSRKVRLGTIEIRRSFDAAPGALYELEVGAEEMHRAELIDAHPTLAITVRALPFAHKVALLDRSTEAYGARSPTSTDAPCGDVFVAAVLGDLVREQRALVREGWRSGAGAAQLAEWMPLLAELGAQFSEPVDVATARGRRFVELVAWLELVARGHDRWFDWLPPLLWVRRGIMVRGVVRSALARLVERACADPKAARTAIRARRVELERLRSQTHDRALPFATDRLDEALGGRRVTCDAEEVAYTRLLTGAEHDALAEREAARAERAAAVLSRAADARSDLLVEAGFDALASRVVARVRVADAAAVEEEAQAEEEAVADASDLSALREAR